MINVPQALADLLNNSDQFLMADLFTIVTKSGQTLRYTTADSGILDPIAGTMPADAGQTLLDFDSGVGIANFIRASVAYKQDGSQVASGVPRFEVGKFNITSGVEGTTNLLIYSNAFNTWAWTHIQSDDFLPGPGTVGNIATNIRPSSGSNETRFISQSITVTANTYTMSVYAKSTGYRWLRLAMGSAAACFDIVAGSVGNMAAGTSGTIVDLGGGWFRCAITYTHAAGGKICYLGINDQNNYNPRIYLGDVTLGITIYAAQVEAKDHTTPEIVTTESIASRPDATTVTPAGAVLDKAIMIEESTSNLCLYSEMLTNAVWTKYNGATATASTITFNAMNQNANQKINLGAAGTVSVDLSGTPGNTVNVYIRNAAGSVGAGRQIILTETSTRYTIIASGLTGSDTYFTIENAAFLGVPAATAAHTFTCTRIQAEAKTYATSYMPTTSATASRNGESCTIPTAGILSASAGTIEGWFYNTGTASNRRAFGNYPSDSTLSHLCACGFNGQYSAASMFVQIGTTNGATQETFQGEWAITGWNHIAITWQVGQQVKFYINGSLKATTIGTSTINFGSTFGIGCLTDASQPLNGLVDELRITPYAKSEAEIYAGYINSRLFSCDMKLKRGSIRQIRGIEVDDLSLTFYPEPTDMVGSIPFLQAVGAGIIDGADVSVERAFFSTSWQSMVGKILRFGGRVSDIEDYTRTEVPITVRSHLELLNIKMPRNVYQPNCRLTLFDTACGLTKTTYGVSGSALVGSTANSIICGLAQAVGWFDLGTITFTSGQNSGLSRTVKSYTPGTVTISYAFPYTPAAGDTFMAYAGCDKLQATCQSKFNNVSKFSGEPYIPAAETAY